MSRILQGGLQDCQQLMHIARYSQIRLAAMERIAAFAQDPSNAQQHCQTLSQGVGTALPGWGEKNFQVMSKQFDVVQAVAATPAAPFGKSDALVGINGPWQGCVGGLSTGVLTIVEITSLPIVRTPHLSDWSPVTTS